MNTIQEAYTSIYDKPSTRDSIKITGNSLKRVLGDLKQYVHNVFGDDVIEMLENKANEFDNFKSSLIDQIQQSTIDQPTKAFLVKKITKANNLCKLYNALYIGHELY